MFGDDIWHLPYSMRWKELGILKGAGYEMNVIDLVVDSLEDDDEMGKIMVAAFNEGIELSSGISADDLEALAVKHDDSLKLV